VPGGGAGPKDARLFAPDQLPALREAARDLRHLRERGYALPSALKVVGDRYQLRDRQRTAISRATSAAAGAAARASRRVPAGAPPPAALGIDGFNLVITCETALNGGVLVTTVDGGLRDLAGIHGAYRTGEATPKAVELIAARLAARGWDRVPARWLLDAPVSNSGRLAARIRACAEARDLPWEVEVVPDPDVLLRQAGPEQVVCTGDAGILEHCGPWLDLAAEAIRAGRPDAWIVELVEAAS
jgi:hypothetical protein